MGSDVLVHTYESNENERGNPLFQISSFRSTSALQHTELSGGSATWALFDRDHQPGKIHVTCFSFHDPMDVAMS